ncbi:hypothetical protein [Clostridioides difficile]|nr:hypothetical protein [Clostridioides difficile]HBE9445703.1 hypothetical protein [Clostridioides difficile]
MIVLLDYRLNYCTASQVIVLQFKPLYLQVMLLYYGLNHCTTKQAIVL